MNKFIGFIAYEGPSEIDGAPIVVIINKINDGSDNAKTGAIVQSFIIRSDAPTEALKTGADYSICGDCARRVFPSMAAPGLRSCCMGSASYGQR